MPEPIEREAEEELSWGEYAALQEQLFLEQVQRLMDRPIDQDVFINEPQETTMSKPTTDTELVQKYADIIDDIVRKGTHGSYTWVGVLGSFLREWLEMGSPEDGEIMETPRDHVDDLLEQLEEKIRQALGFGDPAIIRASDYDPR